ncbi:hypothetical protein ACFYWU_20025 [Streptomyces chrestomyceticus]|nr:hypothetical protein [Streptomyces chrestomyceticus]
MRKLVYCVPTALRAALGLADTPNRRFDTVLMVAGSRARCCPRSTS